MNTYTIYADQVEEVRKRLDRLAKKAANYKIPFSYTISEEHPKKVSVYEVDSVTQTIHTVGTYMVAAVDITVNSDCSHPLRGGVPEGYQPTQIVSSLRHPQVAGLPYGSLKAEPSSKRKTMREVSQKP